MLKVWARGSGSVGRRRCGKSTWCAMDAGKAGSGRKDSYTSHPWPAIYVGSNGRSSPSQISAESESNGRHGTSPKKENNGQKGASRRLWSHHHQDYMAANHPRRTKLWALRRSFRSIGQPSLRPCVPKWRPWESRRQSRHHRRISQL